MTKFKTAALTSSLLMAFSVAHAQSAGGSSTAGGAKGLDNSGSPSSNVKSVEETNRTMNGDAMRPKESAGGSSGASGSSMSSGASGASGSGSSSSSAGTARGLDNSGSAGASPSSDSPNSMTKGDAMMPTKPAGK